MIFGKGSFEEFKPSRRVFAGRGRSMLTFGEWKIAVLSMAFGGAVGAGWFYEAPGGAEIFALSQPAATERPAPPVGAGEATTRKAATEIEVAALPAAAPQTAPQQSLAGVRYYVAQASRIASGASFYLEGVPAAVRLWGVEAGASDGDFDARSTALAELVADETLACERMDADEGGDIIARCFFGDGRDLAAELVGRGAAHYKESAAGEG